LAPAQAVAVPPATVAEAVEPAASFAPVQPLFVAPGAARIVPPVVEPTTQPEPVAERAYEPLAQPTSTPVVAAEPAGATRERDVPATPAATAVETSDEPAEQETPTAAEGERRD
jgi:hypothetical protein